MTRGQRAMRLLSVVDALGLQGWAAIAVYQTQDP